VNIDLTGLRPALLPYVDTTGLPALSGPLLELRNWEHDAHRAGLSPVDYANALYDRADWRSRMAWLVGEDATYVLEHTFEHRPAALARVYDRLGSKTDALPAGLGLLTRVIWLEAGYRRHTEWPRMLQQLHDSGQHMMTSAETAAHRNLPAMVQVYRGFACDPSDVDQYVAGPSWTLALDAAEHFAHRWQASGRVSYIASATVPRQDIAAYFRDDCWEEIVTHPSVTLGSLTITPNGGAEGSAARRAA
jgi:hypothetical protein